MNPHIRPARPEDTADIFALIGELASYERLAHEVDATPEMIAAALFGPDPKVHAEIAELHGEAAGFALWFYSFSTFRGRHGIWLEDLYVRPRHRGRGLGKALMGALAKRCIAEGLPRLEWSVLDWNAPAIGFYKEQGAELMDGWTTCRVTDAGLWRLADQGL
ncbi:GNAT family N-acetyltransferase [Alsobacter sp. SYSU M60028]|uniref:GNAT family N-acetyltransferase n=1 Tax=Alsobacter ponti TaxID=2962936 RepID=A0ABT1LAC9_9HYPH|nr:GNAT family N-acetyltransferase [Alsobacter ponti]MCP8937203.1 GNAT family N-acetyltransferase [Alsobacter ponti]